MSDDLQDTPLLERHRSLGAKLAPFAGWRLPVQFEGTLAEHDAVRSGVGVFDVSHLGTVWIVGADAAAIVADSFTNDPWRLEDGASQYTLCCTEDGGIADDLIVARLDAERFLAVPNAANRAAVMAVLDQAAEGRAAQVSDDTVDWAVIAVQGPRALDVAVGLDLEVTGLDFTRVTVQSRHGEQLLVSRTGYTGEPGVELFVPAAVAGPLWDEVLDAGATPCGLGARDTLRLEMGYPLHGNDLDTDVSPFEARLGWTVRLDRDGRPPGAAALTAARERGPDRRLWGLRGTGRRSPRTGMRVLHDGAPVGQVTSGSFSPTLGVGIGMALVAGPIEPGHRVTVDVRGREEDFEVVRPPFVDRDPRG